MDITRDKKVEIGVRRIIGETLLRLRRERNMSAGEFCQLLGFTSKQYAELEQGTKIMNVPRFLQCISSLGGWVEIHTNDGLTIDTRKIYEVPAMLPEQLAIINDLRQSSSKDKQPGEQ